MFGAKLVVWLGLGVALFVGANWYYANDVERQQDLAMEQLKDDPSAARNVRTDVLTRQTVYGGTVGGWFFLGLILFWDNLSRLLHTDSTPTPERDDDRPPGTRRRKGAYMLIPFASLALLTSPGCYKPYEPNQLETIGPNEEGFLIPLTGDSKRQVSTSSEAFLQQNLVQAKQVRIPQQWVQHGFYWLGLGAGNGEWKQAAMLIKVDKAPVTREWTADEASGTSNRNEAIWVMTADQVEFSTGWTCTARIASKDDAVKFLHNYPNGSLETVMDREIRAMIQTAFGIEVTDLPMEQLRLRATPHIRNVVNKVTTFFQERGINITNLGISGGFVYKNKTIGDKLVEVFNAEQAKAIAAAGVAAQEETNKKIRMEAQGKAEALLTARKAEAQGILAVAEARKKETEVVHDNPEVYMGLRRVELEKEKIAQWKGDFPTFYVGGSEGKAPDMLLNVPAFATTPTKK